MSIDTLLEAARYLEWQAQQQQITREEEERREKTKLSREAEQKLLNPIIQPVQINHVTWTEDLWPQHHHQHHPPVVPPPPLPPPVSIAVIPIPVVAANPAAPSIQTSAPLHAASPLPVVTPLAAALSPPAAPLLSPNGKDANCPPQQQQQQQQQQHCHLVAHIKAEANSLPQTNNSPKPQQTQALLQPYPAPIIAAQHPPQQHTLLPQPALPQPSLGQVQSNQPPRTNGAFVDDARSLDGKRRPGGAGTREVHNKLEKNRRAHLKECFETLKRNVPNVDEKKTSNLSVLRSALRYIQTLKRKEKEYEHEMERLAREKIATQQRLAELKNDLSQCMDVIEIDRILRQTVQPEDDQASTSTASEGEDNFDQDVDEDILSSPPLSSAPKPPAPPEPRVAMAPPTLLSTHISIQHRPTPLPVAPSNQPQPTMVTPQAIAPAPPSHMVTPPQPTVITHASVSHASVIQAVNHVIPAGSKHLAHIAPSNGGQPIGHITMHPVAHLPAALYPQSVAVSQPTVVGHITHTLAHHTHAQVNGTATLAQQGAIVGKPTAVVAHHHAGLMGQTVLNPVTMVTVPPFPVSTLKLA
ncbi:MAX network transcriptional repressor b [Misgurnus anguillicaudatus]|uniref:MAX network transcriptional repressor b n=1 Tax=Misgurnus anguillicaudatus TaxID=75329 RepID=UPI003CCF0D43